MGVLNITPDSFYSGSRVTEEPEIISLAQKMTEEGADILDIGGYSSRPGAMDIPEEEESRRVLKAIGIIRRELPEAVISIDTFRAEIARQAVGAYGVQIINDISGGEGDPGMFRVIEELNVPYVMMHMQGNPRTMQDHPMYDDVVADTLKWFGKKIYRLQSAGVKDLIIDPGFGFGKTIDQSFEMLSRLGDFSIAGLPVLIGISRKSMIWRTLDITPEEALNGTSVLNMAALMNGADILRVHDVKEAVQTIRLFISLRKAGKKQPDN
ncbi:MAG: dihydropteroate synthase [Bacteroidales bacterium]|nr:dihydropteroate synthase [Bacteroidales bacterium]